jgi:hypothetical protein
MAWISKFAKESNETARRRINLRAVSSVILITVIRLGSGYSFNVLVPLISLAREQERSLAERVILSASPSRRIGPRQHYREAEVEPWINAETGSAENGRGRDRDVAAKA